MSFRLFLCLSLSASFALSSMNISYNNSLLELQGELSENEYKGQVKVFMNHQKDIQKLYSQKEKIYGVPENRDIYFLNLLDLHNTAKEIVFAQIMVDEFLRFADFKNANMLQRYIVPIVPTLTSNNVCDGFLVKGQIEEMNSQKKDALETYSKGMGSCKIMYKWESLRGRYNELFYKMYGKIDEKKKNDIK